MKFNKLEIISDWLYKKVIRDKGAPGFIVGLSGTDSIVAFMAAYQAFNKAGRPDRLLGVHFAPSEDFLLDYPEAQKHTWFSEQIVPWLKEKAPDAQIVVDQSIDWRYDGLRWGKLADMSVIDTSVRKMRLSHEKYWVVGTRNKTEDTLYNYSVASTIATVQPVIGLWKSEILDICKELNVPELVVQKSCEADCICGREELRAKFNKELDLVLMGKDDNLPEMLKIKLEEYIVGCIEKGSFKDEIPYHP